MTKRRILVAAGALLAAIGVGPGASAVAIGTGSAVGATHALPTVEVSARSGAEPIEMHVRQGGGDFIVVLGSFDARLSRHGRTDSGRIRMEWGGVPGDRATGVAVDVRVSTVTPVSADVVTFAGRGRREDRATGQVVEFPVAGSARRAATAPDCVIFDIIGGSVHDGIVELPGRFDVST